MPAHCCCLHSDDLCDIPQREVKEHERLSHLLDPTELALAHPPPSGPEQEHREQLQEAYRQLEAEYRAVIERLAASDT